MKQGRTYNDYNRLAPVYDLLGKFLYGQNIRRGQLHFLNSLPPKSRILFIGGGTGFLLNPLMELADPEQVVYIEKSERMIRKSQAALDPRYRDRVEFVHGTQASIAAEDRYDAVLSFFFFDQFRFFTLVRIFMGIDPHVKPGGVWLWADFIPPENWWQKILMRCMLLFFSVMTNLGTDRVYNVPELFCRRGYRKTGERHFYGGFIRSVRMVKE